LPPLVSRAKIPSENPALGGAVVAAAKVSVSVPDALTSYWFSLSFPLNFKDALFTVKVPNAPWPPYARWPFGHADVKLIQTLA
jgi:hypothetical protein